MVGTAPPSHTRRQAGFPTGKTFHARNPELASIPIAHSSRRLRTWNGGTRRENLVVCGPPAPVNVPARSVGQQAVEAGLHVARFSLEDLGVLLRRHRADDTVSKASSPGCSKPTSSSTTSGSSPSATDAAEGPTAWSTPPTRNAPSRSARTCTPPASTNSCPKRWPPPPSTGCAPRPRLSNSWRQRPPHPGTHRQEETLAVT